MFGSQALETTIVLSLLFFLLATASSAVVELLSKILKKRHKELEASLEGLLKGPATDPAPTPDPTFATFLDMLRRTSAFRSVEAAAGAAGASYLSAKAFADAAVELTRKAENVPPGLAARVNQLEGEVEGDLVALKAGLESWFDEAMAALENQYKRWATTVLFAIGLALAVATNSSAVNVALDVWNDTTTRQAVVAAADQVVEAGAEASAITDVARAADELTALQFPVGWAAPPPALSVDVGWWVVHVLGWLLTAAFVMLGAPFWFDLLGRLVSLRSTGQPPAKASADPTSASTAMAARAPTATAMTFTPSGPAGPSGRTDPGLVAADTAPPALTAGAARTVGRASATG